MPPNPSTQADFQPPDDLAKVQAGRWARQLDYVAAHSDFYRRLWQRSAPRPGLAALEELPFTDKEMLRQDQRDQPPFGSYIAAPPAEICRIHRTSGTSGEAMNLALSRRDAAMTAEVGGRAQAAAGLGPGHRVVHCLNYQLWMGGFTDHTTLEWTGATVIPFGVGNSAKLIETIGELQITAISCTPSYPKVLEAVLAESFPALRPRDLGLQLALFGGEPGLDDPAFRARLEETWGFTARNANYGVTDVLCNFAGQCDRQNDLHFMGLDLLYPELIGPEGGLKPWRAGETGELVLTHLAKDCQPLVRFRSGDIITLTATDPCACGRNAPRFQVVGRRDDMVVVRGINVFPSMIAALVNRRPALSGEYRIVLPGPPPYDALPLEVELAPPGTAATDLTQELAAEIKQAIGVAAEVTLRPPQSLPRSEGKTRRVIRKEPKE